MGLVFCANEKMGVGTRGREEKGLSPPRDKDGGRGKRFKRKVLRCWKGARKMREGRTKSSGEADGK